MRALFHHPHAEWDGRARAFAVAARGLRRRGWETRFACCPGTEPERRAEALGIPVHPLAPDAGIIGGSGALARALREHLVDVLYVHGERAHLAAAGGAWRAERGVIVRRFGAGEDASLGRAARATLGQAPMAALCTWAEQAAALPADAGLAAVVTADLGVEADAEGARPRREGPLRRVVCVQTRAVRARTASVLRTVAMLAPRHPELRVALVGPGADDEELRLHAAAVGVNRLVSHHAAASPADLLAEADLAWVIADGDDGAFGVLEALGAGVPVLVERGSDAARYVPDAIGGAHLPPEDVPAAAATLAQLLAHDADRQSMGAAGHARVARSHGEAAMLDGFARVAIEAHARARRR
ncbi:glycosyltransferase [Roseisolibacter sp. H3M3-2]|uniref:glycosyltransferase n=1 Tax=Roseisolibacter sp. H3M3-2 TaxID=3031323 RepID=UPI0023DA79C7|nr:glycosyltransferase [Roseisolibacter sp. H3M3-2]MDF1503084.1 glycosyltransferase [Roseisolibacter sp. H3M3-2]